MIQILQEAALKGGEVLRSYFKKNFSIRTKTTHQNLVTEADIKSQKVIKEYIEKEVTKKFSIPENEIGFIGEEGLYKPGGKYIFAIDPLDGTATFASGFEFFAVIISVFVEGRLQSGVVYDPIKDKLYFAEKSKGAFRKDQNGVQKLLMQQENLQNLYFSGGLGLKEEIRKKQFKIYDKLFPHFRGYISIYSGAISICWLVEDKIGFFTAGGPGVWDIAGAQVVLEEAGGVIVDWKGNKFSYDLTNPDKRYPYFACHSNNLQKILDFMK